MKVEEWIKPQNQTSKLGKNHWSVPRLFELSRELPVMDVPLNHMHVYYVYDKLTLRELVMHMRAALDSDLDYPIILDEDGEIMDGRHRLIKAIFEGRETIKVVRFEINPSPCRRDE